IWYSAPGNGVSHPVHMERFGRPGKSLLGSDSHTCAAGAMGMLAIGAGGLEVAMAMAGEPVYLTMPRIWGVRLVGRLPDWVSAKDVILEMLRRHGVAGGRGRVIEYHGEGLEGLTAMDRHVIANMGAELGATTTVFPADEAVKRFLEAQGRGDQFCELLPDPDARYDVEDEIDLSKLEPLIAMPSSPGNVVPVREVAGQEIYQAYIGSSANPGFRDFAVVATMVAGRQVHPGVSLDINPATRRVLVDLAADGFLSSLVQAGARLHQAGCNGCIGMGQAPATGRISLRTVPRNFPGRSGTREDRVCLVSPETAAASALTGRITDPRTLSIPCPRVSEPSRSSNSTSRLLPPLPAEESREIALAKGPNIASLPRLEDLPDRLTLAVVLKVGDDISTDDIMPAGARVLPFRSNIPQISRFCFDRVDPTYHERASKVRESGGHVVIGGNNYGQGSSREHAALAPRFLGLRAVLARSFARIHWQNLIAFGVLPIEIDPVTYESLEPGDVLEFTDLREVVAVGRRLLFANRTRKLSHEGSFTLSSRQRSIVLAGGLINWIRDRLTGTA
ncbi:MAG: aconitate hydratase, partial [Candidatus Riflebacteria bacterium]|nr:aconitate hydratase [Candidatus Riflebacteria bacterium]